MPFVLNKSVVKLSEQFFSMLRSEVRQYIFFGPQLGTVPHFVVFGAIFIVWFLHRPMFASVLIYTTCANQWMRLNRQ